MRDDDQGAHRWREIIVWIAFKAHVLGEVFRFHQLTDIVKIRADAAECRICADRFRGGFSEIGHDQAVMISARRSEEHTSELQSRFDLVCRLLLEKKKAYKYDD